MKNTIVILAVALMASFSMKAQNTTPIGKAHQFSYSAFLGYGSGNICRFAGGSVDWNAPSCNLRARLTLNLDQFMKGIAGSAAAEADYLLGLSDALFVYPLVNAKFEYHNEDAGWDSATSIVPGAGAGIEYQFNSRFGIFAQAQYEYTLAVSQSRAVCRAGVVLAFGKGTRAVRAEADKAQARLAATEAAKVHRERTAAEHQAIRDAEDAKFAARVAGTEDISNDVRGSRYLIPFQVGSTKLSDSGRQLIMSVVMLLKENYSLDLDIAPGPAYGASSDGTGTYSELPAKRAEIVRTFILNSGIDPVRVRITGDTVASDFVAVQIR